MFTIPLRCSTCNIVVVVAAAADEAFAADAWLLMLLLQPGVVAKYHGQVSWTHYYMYWTAPAATTTSASTSLEDLGSARWWVDMSFFRIQDILPLRHGW